MFLAVVWTADWMNDWSIGWLTDLQFAAFLVYASERDWLAKNWLTVSESS